MRIGYFKIKRKEQLPGVLRWAGLMVLDPSIIPLPMPFIEVVTGCDVEYISARVLHPRRSEERSRLPLVRKGTRGRELARGSRYEAAQ